MGNCIDFANAILKNEKIIKGEPKVHYSLVKYKQTGSYNILKYISENFTLVQLMDSLIKVNRAIGVVGYWILNQTTRKHLSLIGNQWT